MTASFAYGRQGQAEINPEGGEVGGGDHACPLPDRWERWHPQQEHGD